MTEDADIQVSERRASDQAHAPSLQMLVDKPGWSPRPRRLTIPRDVDLTRLAVQVRKVFIRERRIFEGRSLPRPGFDVCPSDYVPSRRWDEPMDPSRTCDHGKNVWSEVAELVALQRWDAEDYIKRAFDRQPIAHTLEPDQLLSREMFYRHYDHWDRKEKLTEISVDLDRQKELFDARLLLCRHHSLRRGGKRSRSSLKEMIRGILSIEFEPSLTPWFCFCMASRYDLRDVDHYREAAAWTYYRFREDYDVVCCDFIPGSLKRDAGQLYSDALVRLGLDDASL